MPPAIAAKTPAAPWCPPLLRWAGSKKKSVPHLRQHFPPKWNRYIEPFAGSACLFFAIHPCKAILGDFNGELIHAYRVLQRHPRCLSKAVHEIPRTRAAYQRIRSIDPKTEKPLQRAAHFIYLNRNCFNGVYRTNRKGLFNVPMGSRMAPLPNEAAFFRCSVALRNVDLLACDFFDTCSRAKKGDIVYLDPPYTSCQRPRFGEYGYDSFQPIELSRLKTCLAALNKKGVHFLLSYNDSPDIRDELGEWTIRSFTARRHVAGFAQHRTTVNELLVSNY